MEKKQSRNIFQLAITACAFCLLLLYICRDRGGVATGDEFMRDLKTVVGASRLLPEAESKALLDLYLRSLTDKINAAFSLPEIERQSALKKLFSV